MAIQFRLNPGKSGNYAFFCPVTKLHLTIANPGASVDRISNYIFRGIKSKSLIDVNNSVNLDTGELNIKEAETKQESVVEKVKEEKTVTKEVKQEAVVTQDQKEESSQVVEVAAEEKKSKRGKRAEVAPVDEAATE